MFRKMWRWLAGAQIKRQAEEDRRCEQEALTGWWVTPAGDVVLVRFDPVIGRFLVDGLVWPDAGAVASYLRICESEEGWMSLGDAATEGVRERLRL